MKLKDTGMTAKELKAMVRKYMVETYPRFDFVAERAEGMYLYDEKGEEVFGFGKHKGKKVADVLQAEPSYYDWVQKADFPLYTKQVLTEIRLRTKFRR